MTIRTMLAVVLVCLGFGVTSQLILQLAETRETTLDLPEVRERIAELLQAGGRFDAVFLGSSRVYRAIDPMALESHAESLGCSLNSFNLGVPGLSLLEQKEILQHLGTLDLQIDSVFFEPYSVANRDLDLVLSERRRRFYTWSSIGSTMRDQWTLPAPRRQRLRTMGYLAYGFVFENSGAGQMSEAAFGHPKLSGPTPAVEPRPEPSVLPPGNRGYRAIEDETLPTHLASRRKFESTRSAFLAKVERAQADPDRTRSSGKRAELVMEIARTATASGLQPVVLIVPSPQRVPHSNDLVVRLRQVSNGTLQIYNLNSPSLYPELFDPDNWWDGAHVNRSGAHEIARSLASEICNRRSEN